MDSIAKTSAGMHDLPTLISDPENMHVGFVVSMTYDKVLVLTNDQWKHRCGGIPQNSFLVAASFDPTNFATTPEEDRTVVLLRVIGPKPLPSDSDSLKSIVEKYQRATHVQAEDQHDGFERITMSRLQYSGMECHILGSFQVDDLGRLTMGSDVEDYFAVARLRVYKPVADVLERVVNFISPDRLAKAQETAEKLLGSLPDPIPIGNVRYTSSTAVQRANKADVPVRIQPLDFLARRTAVFGMTRTGKSNTVKTAVASVATVAKKAGVRVGQVIFDIKGEYANANGDDNGKSIAEALDADVVRYGAHGRPGFKDLRNNFYDSLEAGLQILQEGLRAEPGTMPQDYRYLLELTLDQPDPANTGDTKRWERNCAIYRCVLNVAGFPLGPGNANVMFGMNPKVYLKFHEERLEPDCTACKTQPQKCDHAKLAICSDYGATANAGGVLSMPIANAVTLWGILRDIDRELVKNGAIGLESSGSTGAIPKAWLDPTSRALLNVMQGKNDGGQAFRNPRALYAVAGKQHSPSGLESVPQDVYENLIEGKIVILDLSAGSEKMKDIQAQKIADFIFVQNTAKYTSGERAHAPIIMMYVEEAHNLIGKDKKIDTTWPRIAKEGAAYKIGLVYSTQEPSSIHPNIMANTENFFVTHLNNDDEIRTISKFYDFGDFAGVIKKATDVGFSRIKTLSSSFVVPTQILQFRPEIVKAEYDAAGRKPEDIKTPKNGSPGT